MNGADLLRAVDYIYREKAVNKEVIFSNIEKAVRQAIVKHYEDEDGIEVAIDRTNGEIFAKKGEKVLKPDELGRIAASSAKQMIIQGIRDEESTAVFNAYAARKGDLVTGTIQRFEGGAAIVSLDGKTEALLPRGEQIPGETHHINERVKAVILEVRKNGHRVRIILSRTSPEFVRRLFEEEIPEIQDQTISIKAVAREAGYRAKVAVSSIDMKVDCVGACVGVRGSRIKNIVDELGGERIDIVRWNDSLQVLIPYALQPAAVEEVFLYQRLGRAIVLVKEDQLSLAIGRRGQNVRLASKLVGWDIEIMTHEEYNEGIERAVGWFTQIPHVTDEMVEAYIEEGFLSYDDLTFLEPAELAEFSGVTVEQAQEMIDFCEEAAERVEEEQRIQKAAEAAARAAAPPPVKETPEDRVAKLFGEAPGEDGEGEAPLPTAESLFAEAPAAATEAPAEELAEVSAESTPAEAPPETGETLAEPAAEPPPEAGETSPETAEPGA